MSAFIPVIMVRSSVIKQISNPPTSPPIIPVPKEKNLPEPVKEEQKEDFTKHPRPSER